MTDPAARVELAFPPSSQFLRLARLTASGLATDLGFDIEEIEDLRVAVDELCALLIPGGDGEVMVRLTYEVGDGSLRVDGERAVPEPPPSLHPIAEELLEVTVDEHAVSSTDGHRRFHLLKRRHSS